MNESMNDEAVYTTAPATPGLLKRVCKAAEDYEIELTRVWASSARPDPCANSIHGISTAAEARAEAAVEMPRILYSQ